MEDIVRSREVWTRCRVKAGPGSIELHEQRLHETVFLLCIIAVPPIVLGIAYYCIYGYFDWVPALFCLVITVWMASVSIREYNAPRVLQLFPGEMIACSSRLFFVIRYRQTWHNLAESTLIIRRVTYEAEREIDPVVTRVQSTNRWQAFLRELWVLIDPLDSLLGFYRLINREKVVATAFALTVEGSDPFVLAVFKEESDAENLLRAFKPRQSYEESTA